MLSLQMVFFIQYVLLPADQSGCRPAKPITELLIVKCTGFKELGSQYFERFDPLSSVGSGKCQHTHKQCGGTGEFKYLNWGYHAHPCFLNKQRNPTLPPKPLLAPKSRSFAKSSLTLNIHSAGEEKANSGKVQDWRQREPHVRNSFLITGNVLAYCIKKCSGSYSSF